MSRMRIAGTAFIALMVALGLTACAPAVTPTATPSAGPSSGASAAAPTPTPTTLADPVVRLSVGCDDLLSTSAVDTAVGDNAVVLQLDQDAAPTTIYTIAARQNGTLQCAWGGKTQTDGGYDDGINLSVAVDAADAYAHYVPIFESQYGGTPVVNTSGDKSEYTCSGGNNHFLCGGNVLVGTNWVSIELQNSYKGGASVAVAKTRMQQTMSSVATRLAGVSVLPAWAAPVASVSPFCSDAADTTATVRKVFSAPTMTIVDLTGQLGPTDASVTNSPANAIVSCNWRGKVGDDYLSVDELPNGAWALPELVASPPLLEGVGTYAPVTMVGADATLFVHGGEGASGALFSIGSNLYDVSYNDYGSKKDTAILTKLVAALAD